MKASARFDKMRIVRDDSPRGGVIQIPVARQATIRLDRTAGGGDGNMNVTGDVFAEMVKNFEAWPKPVNAYFGHATKENPRKADTPAIGVVTDIFVEGDTLWNELKIGPKAWDLMVTQQGFNAASIEGDEDLGVATGDFEGYVQHGLAITNNPALPVQYLAAEGGANQRRRSVQFSASWQPPDIDNKGEVAMDLEALKGENVKLSGKVVSLEESESKLKTKVLTLEGENEELKKRPTIEAAASDKAKITSLELENAELKKRPTVDKMLELEGDVRQLKLENLGGKVRELKIKALASGKIPAFFEKKDDFVGCDEDPVKFLEQRFGGSIAALKLGIESAPTAAVKLGDREGPGSGSGGGVAGNAKELLLSEIKKLEIEKKLSFSEAAAEVRALKPELFAEGTRHYQPPSEDAN